MKTTRFIGDTTLEAAQVQWEIFRRMPPAKRMALACSMSDSIREVVAAGVRSRHPDYSDVQVKRAVIKLSLGDALYRQVYPGLDVDP
ncbi:MAG: hypothetical protein HY040_29105 [Planctomycetes bacterium]|nr:hypothetical protein [Planctomycetota bacterium]